MNERLEERIIRSLIKTDAFSAIRIKPFQFIRYSRNDIIHTGIQL
jgi:hypothetical protein